MNYEQVLKNVLRYSTSAHTITEKRNEDFDVEVELIVNNKKYSAYVSVRDDIDDAYFILLCNMCNNATNLK